MSKAEIISSNIVEEIKQEPVIQNNDKAVPWWEKNKGEDIQLL